MTTGDFDFFGKPTGPPPGPPGVPAAPAVNQFGMPVPTDQFGMPIAAPPRPATIAPATPAEKGRQVAIIGGVVVAIVLAVVGFLYLQSTGKKTATKVADTIETPIVKAHQTEETIDLQQAVVAQDTYLADHDSYATSIAMLSGFVDSPTTKVTVVSASATTFCLRADDTSSFHAPSMYVSSAVPGASPTPCS